MIGGMLLGLPRRKTWRVTKGFAFFDKLEPLAG